MKNYRYNLDQMQAKHFASLKPGETMVFVVPLIPQPVNCPGIGNVWRGSDNQNDWGNYPVSARIGLRETWSYAVGYYLEPIYLFKASYTGQYEDVIKWRSAQCMPVEAIRYWVTVKETRVCQIQNITNIEAIQLGISIGINTMNGIINWFDARYAPKFTWEMNPYCEIFTVEKK